MNALLPERRKAPFLASDARTKKGLIREHLRNTEGNKRVYLFGWVMTASFGAYTKVTDIAHF